MPACNFTKTPLSHILFHVFCLSTKLGNASLEVYEKNSFTHSLSCILPFNEVARCQSGSLRRKLFHTFSFMYFAFHPLPCIFSECISITSSEEALKVCEHNFFQRKVVLLIIYLFNHDSFKPTIFTIFLLNMSFEVLLSAVSCNIKLFALCFDRYFFIKT